MSKRSTIALTAMLVLGAASAAMAMGERNPVGRHSGPGVGQTGAVEYGFSAAEKAWFDRASQQSNR
jgi:hypothetical protein